MATTSEIARALVEYINDQTYDTLFTAIYSWMPKFDLVELDDLIVSVSPRSNIIENADRASTFEDHAVVIMIQKRVSGDDIDNDVMDTLDALSNQIKNKLTRINLTTVSGVKWYKTSYDQIAMPEMIRENRQFTAVLTINFRGRVK